MADRFPADLPVVVEQSRWPEGRAWLAELPGIVASLERDWAVVAAAPFEGGSASWVAPATTALGEDAVLKVNLPHREARDEAAALTVWAGHGAVRVHRRDADRWALLIERCWPGDPVHECGLAPEDALAAAAEVLVRLWGAAVPTPSAFETLGAVTTEWADDVRSRMERLRPPVDAGLVEYGAVLLETLPATAATTVVLHGDFNPGNVLSSERGWLAIDAKPMVGDPAYDPVPMLGQVDDPFQHADASAVVRRRYALFADLTGQPFERLCAWGFARHIEWCLWYAEREESEQVAECADHARVLAALAGI